MNNAWVARSGRSSLSLKCPVEHCYVTDAGSKRGQNRVYKWWSARGEGPVIRGEHTLTQPCLKSILCTPCRAGRLFISSQCSQISQRRRSQFPFSHEAAVRLDTVPGLALLNKESEEPAAEGNSSHFSAWPCPMPSFGALCAVHGWSPGPRGSPHPMPRWDPSPRNAPPLPDSSVPFGPT